jgi:hypothetical protein
MNAAQYKIVKTITNFPKCDTKKFAKMIKQPHSEVLRVQASATFEQYQDKETSYDDLMSMFMGGKNPFGGTN